MQPRGQLASRAVAPGQRPRLHQVRGDHRREREEPADEGGDGVVLEQLRARARDHDRVDDERHAPVAEVVGDRLDQRPGEEHSGLGGIHADVVEDRVELRAHELGRQLVDRRHADRILRRQRDEDRRAVRSRRGECLEVGLDARSAAGVGGRDRERAWNWHGSLRRY